MIRKEMTKSQSEILQVLLSEYKELELLEAAELPGLDALVLKNGSPGHYVLALVSADRDDQSPFGAHIVKTNFELLFKILHAGAFNAFDRKKFEESDLDFSLVFVGTEKQVDAIKQQANFDPDTEFWDLVKTIVWN